MYQTPTSIWNEIAQTQALQHPIWRRLFALDQDSLTVEMEKLEKELEEKGADARVIRGYVLTAPLLMENEAISLFVEASGSTSLRSCLPEVTTINEAVALATEEFRLKPSQQTFLAKLLTTAYATPESAASSV
jgi:hypothetical protein